MARRPSSTVPGKGVTVFRRSPPGLPPATLSSWRPVPGTPADRRLRARGRCPARPRASPPAAAAATTAPTTPSPEARWPSTWQQPSGSTGTSDSDPINNPARTVHEGPSRAARGAVAGGVPLRRGSEGVRMACRATGSGQCRQERCIAPRSRRIMNSPGWMASRQSSGLDQGFLRTSRRLLVHTLPVRRHRNRRPEFGIPVTTTGQEARHEPQKTTIRVDTRLDILSTPDTGHKPAHGCTGDDATRGS